MEGEKKTMNTGLWLECAGPLVTLPTVGSHVVYFPQGHSEQVIASTQRDGEAEIPNYPNLPAHLICQLHNITLHADPETDEVYAQMTLQPVQHEKEPYLTHDLGIQSKQPTLSFCKTLTASDTSTHGGFSIPRRAAEKVFPPLDFTKQPPAQELVARDLHNHEWPFRHIYRGQPKRHLLTTGWSVFVSSKRLQAGDTVLFMRDENNQLLLGIRRANRQQANVPSSLLSSDSMLIGVLAAAAHAAATNSRFTIYYNPRASYSEFVVPFCRFSKATYHPRVTVGMRFRMELETEDSSTRRYMGTITGIGDLDPGRWPNSLWRTLKVGWDESTAGQRQKRVSLWEIEPLTAPYFPCASSLFLRKRPRLDGDIDDLESMSRSQVWARGEDGKMDIRTLNAAGLSSIDHWLRLQQKPEIISSASSQPDYFRALAAQALQEIRTVDSTKQQLLHQQQIPPVIQMQYRQSQFSQQQQLQAHQNHLQQQQQQMLQQQHQHQQQHQQLQQQQQQHQQHQQQHQQHQHQQHHQQQHQQQQEHQQHQQQHQQQQRHQQQHQNHQLQLPGSTCSMLQQPSHGSQPGHLMSSASRVPSGFSESDLGGFSGIPGNSISLQSLLNRPSSDSLIQDNSPQYSNGSLRSNQVPLQQQQQQHNMPSMLAPPGLLAQEPQLSGSWMSSIRDSNSNAQHVLSPRALESSGNPFMLRVDPPVPAATGSQASLGPLTLQQAPYVYRDAPHQEQESVQSDPRSSHLLFGVNIDSPLMLSSTPGAFPAGGLEKSKDIQFSMLGGSCSPSGSDMHISGGVPPVDDNSPSNWQQQQQQQVQPSPVRTFTKVYKTGSVGRSIDVTRLKNYDELRREIARMFGLEGQLHVDPSRSSWQLVFVDNEGDVLLVGDDPWEEFVTCVRFIKILSPSEVLQMNREGIESLAALPSQRQTSSSSEDCAMQQDNNTNTHNYAQDPRMAYHRQDF